MTALTRNPSLATANKSLLLWINRSLESLWLLAIILVPLVFLGRSYGEWSSIIGSFELPKIALLRTLVGLMAVLCLVEWAAVGRPTLQLNLARLWYILSPRVWFTATARWLAYNPANWVKLAAALFLGSTLLSTVLSVSFNVSMWGDVPGQDSYGAYTVITYVLLFGIIATHLKTQAQLQRILGAVVFMGVLVAGYSVLQYYAYDFLDLIEPPTGSRSSSTIGNPLFAGALLMMTVPMSLAAAACTLEGQARSNRRWLLVGAWALILTVQFLGLWFTFSRGPWIATISSVVALVGLSGLLVGWRQLSRTALVLMAAIALTSAIALLVPRPLPETDTGGSTSEEIDTRFRALDAPQRLATVGGQLASGGIGGRVEIWRTSWTLMTDHPWFGFEPLKLSALRPLIGYGPDTFRYAYLLKSPPRGDNLLPFETDQAHNYFVHQAVEQGFLGMLTSLGVFVALFAVGGYQLLRLRGNFSKALSHKSSPPVSPSPLPRERGRRMNLGGTPRPLAEGAGPPLQSPTVEFGDRSITHRLVLIALLSTLAGRFLEQLVGLARVSDLTILWVLLAIFVALAGINEVSREKPYPDFETGSRSSRSRRPERSPAGSGRRQWQVFWQILAIAGLTGGIGLLIWARNVEYWQAAGSVDQAAEQFRGGRFQAALSSVDRAIDRAPDVSSNYQARARIYWAQRSNNLAPQELKCRLEADGSANDVCLAREAYAVNQDWTQKRPFDFRARLSLADSALDLGLLTKNAALTSESIRLYGEAADMVPNSWRLWNRLAEVYISLGQPEAALPALEKSLAITGFDQRSHRALLLQGLAIRDLGRFQQAVGVLDQAIQLSTGGAEANYIRGTAYFELGQYQTAIRDFDEVLRLDPRHALAYNYRGLSYARLSRFSRAILDFSNAIQLEPQLAVAYNNRGYALRELGHLDSALDDLNRAIQLSPQMAIAYFNRALVYTLLGRSMEAGLDAERAIQHGFDPALLKSTVDELKKRR